MLARELIAKIRLRLRDEAKEGWSDDELIDMMNLSFSAIAHDFMLWKSRCVIVASSGVDTYSIPEDFMAPISLIVAGDMIPIYGIEQALRNQSEEVCGFIHANTLILNPEPAVGTEIILNYHSLYQCCSMDTKLQIGTEYMDTLIYYTMSQALQKEPTENALEKSKYFLQMYKDRVDVVSKISNQRRNSTAIKSSFQRI